MNEFSDEALRYFVQAKTVPNVRDKFLVIYFYVVIINRSRVNYENSKSKEKKARASVSGYG